MDLLDAIVLGIVEGLTEFLPVSSTGHMILLRPWLGIEESSPTVSVFLFASQLGAILAVVVYFWRDLWRHTLQPATGGIGNHLVLKLLVALAPSIVAGVLLNDFMEAHLENNLVAVAGALIVGALVIAWVDARWRNGTVAALESVSWRQALWIGVAQTVSLWPGVSRSAATICGGMLAGLKPTTATEFSFYLAIPTMFAAAGYRLLKHGADLDRQAAGIVLLGAGVSFIVALGVVAGFMAYVRRYRFTPFVIYRILLGGAVVAYALAGRATVAG